jgi:hypothetical protein
MTPARKRFTCSGWKRWDLNRRVREPSVGGARLDRRGGHALHAPTPSGQQHRAITIRGRLPTKLAPERFDHLEDDVADVAEAARTHGIGVITAAVPDDYDTREDREEARRPGTWNEGPGGHARALSVQPAGLHRPTRRAVRLNTSATAASNRHSSGACVAVWRRFGRSAARRVGSTSCTRSRSNTRLPVCGVG